jgi:hypothetical protein
MRQGIERCENKIDELLQLKNKQLISANSMNVEPVESREVYLDYINLKSYMLKIF